MGKQPCSLQVPFGEACNRAHAAGDVISSIAVMGVHEPAVCNGQTAATRSMQTRVPRNVGMIERMHLQDPRLCPSAILDCLSA
jgi:hypothetical protein